MKPNDPNVGALLSDLSRTSFRQINAQRLDREREEVHKSIYTKCPPGHMTRREMCEHLNISLSLIKYYMRIGLIPFVKIGYNVYFNPDEVVEAYNKINHARGRGKG